MSSRRLNNSISGWMRRLRTALQPICLQRLLGEEIMIEEVPTAGRQRLHTRPDFGGWGSMVNPGSAGDSAQFLCTFTRLA